MFEAPSLISSIPDIAKIYEINKSQEDELIDAVKELDQNIFLSSMNLSLIKRWEAILNIKPLDDDTLDDRRFRIKSKIVERVPYTYKVIYRKICALCPDGFSFVLDDNLTFLKVMISLSSKKMKTDVDSFLEEVLPLNMNFYVGIIYNRYGLYEEKSYKDMTLYTYKELREKIMEGGE